MPLTITHIATTGDHAWRRVQTFGNRRLHARRVDAELELERYPPSAAELPPEEPPGAMAALPPSLRRHGEITLPK